MCKGLHSWAVGSDCLHGGYCNSTLSTMCICEDGFANKGDFFFEEDEGMCQVNVVLIDVLWSVCIGLSVLVTPYHAYLTLKEHRRNRETSEQLKARPGVNTKPQKGLVHDYALVFDISVLLVGVNKVTDRRNYLGDDPLTSMLFGLNYVGVWLHILMLIQFFTSGLEILVGKDEHTHTKLRTLLNPFKIIFALALTVVALNPFVFCFVNHPYKGLYAFNVSVSMLCVLLGTSTIFAFSATKVLIDAVHRKTCEIDQSSAANQTVLLPLHALLQRLKTIRARVAFLGTLDLVFICLQFIPVVSAFRSYVYPIQNIFTHMSILSIEPNLNTTAANAPSSRRRVSVVTSLLDQIPGMRERARRVRPASVPELGAKPAPSTVSTVSSL